MPNLIAVAVALKERWCGRLRNGQEGKTTAVSGRLEVRVRMGSEMDMSVRANRTASSWVELINILRIKK